jgi:hypothetical protein
VTINSTLGGSTAPGSQDVGSNSTIVITASPDPFFEFRGWTGSFAASANPLSIVVTSNLNLTASFQKTGFTDDFETGGLHKLNWITAGNQPWLVQTNIALAGRFAARSGAIGNGQSSSLMFTTNFPGGTASFYLKVSSELGWDSLSFYLDGVMQDQWSGEVDWTSFSLPVPAGLHTLEWRYAKDATDSAGLDAAFIDNVNLPLLPELGPPVPALLTINRQPDGSLIVQVLGRTNQQYVIQSTMSLTPPIVWQNLSTNIATGGVINFPATAADQLRFYRTVVPLP